MALKSVTTYPPSEVFVANLSQALYEIDDQKNVGRQLVSVGCNHGEVILRLSFLPDEYCTSSAQNHEDLKRTVIFIFGQMSPAGFMR